MCPPIIRGHAVLPLDREQMAGFDWSAAGNSIVTPATQSASFAEYRGVGQWQLTTRLTDEDTKHESCMYTFMSLNE